MRGAQQRLEPGAPFPGPGPPPTARGPPRPAPTLRAPPCAASAPQSFLGDAKKLEAVREMIKVGRRSGRAGACWPRVMALRRAAPASLGAGIGARD